MTQKKLRRTIKKQIWMNQAEDQELKKKARLACLSEAALIRLLIKGYHPKEKPDDTFYKYMREMSLIGNNINQIAARVNSLGIFDSEGFQAEMEKLHQLEADLEAHYLMPEDRRYEWQ